MCSQGWTTLGFLCRFIFFWGGVCFHGCVFLLSVTASVFCRLHPLEVGGDLILGCVSGVEVHGCISSWAPCWVGGADILWVCLRGQGLRLICLCIPNIKEKAWPRGNLHKYLSDDDLLKENLYNGAYGEFLRVCTLRLSWGFLLTTCMSDSVSVCGLLLSAILFPSSVSV